MLSHVSFSSLQVLGESLYISGKYLDYEGKLVEAQSKTNSLSTENKSLKDQITALINEAKKDKDRIMIYREGFLKVER